MGAQSTSVEWLGIHEKEKNLSERWGDSRFIFSDYRSQRTVEGVADCTEKNHQLTHLGELSLKRKHEVFCGKARGCSSERLPCEALLMGVSSSGGASC